MENIDYFQLIQERYRFSNSQLVTATGISNLIGFLQYLYCVHALWRKKEGPLPVWMHTFFLAHDSYWCYVLGAAAPRYNNHWYLSGMSKGLFVWTLLEVWSIYKTVKDHRLETFTPLFGPDPRLGPVYSYIFMHLLAMYAVIILGVVFMGNKCVIQWFGTTNILMAVGPTHEYLRHGSKKKFPMGFLILNVASIVWTFAPFGQWVLAFPEIYDRSEYYVVGMVFFLYSIWCCGVVARLNDWKVRNPLADESKEFKLEATDFDRYGVLTKIYTAP